MADDFTTVDGISAYVNKYIGNSAVEAFTQMRLNTALHAMLGLVQEIQESGVGGGGSVLYDPDF
jgi:hypothetical protein